MIVHRHARAVGVCALLLVSVSPASIAIAQAQAPVPGEVLPPERASYDENGVNVATGTYRAPRQDLSIGSGKGALTAPRIYGMPTYRYAQIPSNVVSVGQTVAVATGAFTRSFQKTAAGYVSLDGDGSTYVETAGGPVMTMSDGTQYIYGFAQTDIDTSGQAYTTFYRLSSIRYPDGSRQDLNWVTIEHCRSGGNSSSSSDNMSVPANCPLPSGGQGQRRRGVRLQSITNNAGYMIHFKYLTDTINYSGPFLPQYVIDWHTATAVTGINTTVEACGVTAYDCPLAGAWPRTSYATSVSGAVTTEQATDAVGRTTTYIRQAGTGVTPYEAVRRPGSSVDDLRVTMDASYRVTSILRDGATWNYTFATPSAGSSTLTVTGPTGRVRRYTSDTTIGLPTRTEDEYGRITLYTYDSKGRLLTGTTPGGQVTTYTYDLRGNVTNTVVTAVGGATMASAATFPSGCTSGINCNKPVTTTDVRGVATSYGYDPTHGGVTSVVTQNAGGTSPGTQVRYAQVGGVWLPVRSWSCRTQAACDGTADAVQTTIGYNANLLPVTVTSGAGDGSLVATTTSTWTPAGDVMTVDGPVPGGADTTRYHYDATRAVTGAIGPDPDGAGALKYRATRLGFDNQGRATSVAQGTATDQSATALAAMTVLQTQTATLDAAGRTVSAALSAGGTTFSRVDYRYDAAGYAICSAQRMNPSALSAPGDACVVGGDAGFGPDRVVRTSYGAFGTPAGATTTVTSAFGTADASSETVAQNAGGQPASVTDGNGNVTTYGYDGFGRRTTTTYPGGSYEQATYAANGDVTAVRLRDGKQVTFGYDGLGRRSSMAFANPVDLTDANVTYSYDLIGRVTLAQDVNAHKVGYAYDALGRATSEAGAWGTLASQYDVAGRRTRLTWGDGFYVSYEYDATGAMTAIRENGSTLLASYGYDDLGRRVSRSLGNGTGTSYGYDGASRLTALGLTGGNQPLGVTLSYNPAGQIASRTGSNDAYAFAGSVNVDRTYTVNGLNQYTASGSVVPTYDGRGNLTSAGGATYLYNSKNQLSGANGTYLYYDPAGRLDQATQAGLTWEWDGAALVTERTGGAIARRYVHGAGVDEPVVWYEGAGTGDRRWLDADERGSIVRVTNGSGTALAVNRYDEYGIPGSGNLGRFQYTGQMYLPELGFYYYKARMYSPTLGRFMQTDPIGYGDGLNWYNYVGSDPVNGTDPSGLCYASRIVSCEAQMRADSGGAGGGLGGGGGGNSDIVVTGRRLPLEPPKPYFSIDRMAFSGGGAPQLSHGEQSTEQLQQNDEVDGEIVVTARARVLAARAQATVKVSLNDLAHIFDNPDHLLDGVLQAYGSAKLAGDALSTRAQLYVNRNHLVGKVQFQVRVAGYDVTVRGMVVNGTFRFGTAFIAPR